MKIKYKLIGSIIIIILIAIVPLAWFILDNQTTEKISATKQLGKLNAMLLARGAKDTIMNNLASNDLEALKIDSDELLGVFKELKGQGLVFAQTIRISDKKKNINGLVLAEIKMKKEAAKQKKEKEQEENKKSKVSTKTLKELRSIKDSRKVVCAGSKKEICYEFSAIGTVVQGEKKYHLAIARMQFSRAFVLAPIKKLQGIIFFAAGLQPKQPYQCFLKG